MNILFSLIRMKQIEFGQRPHRSIWNKGQLQLFYGSCPGNHLPSPVSTVRMMSASRSPWRINIRVCLVSLLLGLLEMWAHQFTCRISSSIWNWFVLPHKQMSGFFSVWPSLFICHVSAPRVEILGISELKWTEMGHFQSDEYKVFFCRQDHVRRNGVAIICDKDTSICVMGY